MKKKLIIISVMILFTGMILGVNFVFTSNKKVDTKEICAVPVSKKENSHEEKNIFYAKSIPKVDQEYTISNDDSTSVYPISMNSEEVLDNTNIINDSEVIILENSSMQREDEIFESSNEESLSETSTEEVISSEDSSLIETEKEKDNDRESITSKVAESYNIQSEEIINETMLIQNEPANSKNGFYEEDGSTYYYEKDIKVTGMKNINGVDNYFSPSGKYLGTNNIKVIDVSYYQKDIDWELFANESDCYGVILRLGYYETLDKKFERNINELKRLNIPYGIYLFSYSSTLGGAKKEADFTNKMITKYDINPTLGIYYDIESWSTKMSSSNNISKTMYDNIIQHYINSVSYYTNYKYKVKVYSGRWYAMNRLGNISKKHVDWVAEYNKKCKYDDEYSMWQYTSKGNVPGVEGNVDISYIL